MSRSVLRKTSMLLASKIETLFSTSNEPPEAKKEVREVLASQYELSARIRLSKRYAYSFMPGFSSASGLTFFTNFSAPVQIARMRRYRLCRWRMLIQ